MCTKVSSEILLYNSMTNEGSTRFDQKYYYLPHTKAVWLAGILYMFKCAIFAICLFSFSSKCITIDMFAKKDNKLDCFEYKEIFLFVIVMRWHC